MLYPVSSSGSILQNYSTIEPEYWHWYNQDTEYFHQKNFLHCPCRATPTSLLLPHFFLYPWQPLICSQFLQFCHFKNDKWNHHSDRYIVIPCRGFNLHLMLKIFFMCLFAIFMSLYIFCPFFIWTVCFDTVEFAKFFIYSLY